jgi:hypothetical protein
LQLADYTLWLAGTGQQVMISNSYNRHNARYRCSPVPARKNLLFAGDSFSGQGKTEKTKSLDKEEER